MSDLSRHTIPPSEQPSTGLLAALNDAAAELFDPFEITSRKWPKSAATCGQLTLWRVYPGDKPFAFTPRCTTWHCYLKSHGATCVDLKAVWYATWMARLPMFDGWGTVRHMCVTERGWSALRRLAVRRDARWVRVPVFGGMSHVFSDVDLSTKGTERPPLQMSAEEAGGVVLALLRGHKVARKPTMSANLEWSSYGKADTDEDEDKPKSFVLPGAHPLILDRTWHLFSGRTVELFGFESGPGVAFPHDLDREGLLACWYQARDEAAEEKGWATRGRRYVADRLLGESGDTPPSTPPTTGATPLPRIVAGQGACSGGRH